MDVILERFGFENVENLLDELGDKAQPPKIVGLWGEILDDTLIAERRLFATGRGWKDTKTATKQRKARDKDPRVRANAGRVNVASGALRDFMTSKGPAAQPLKMDADELRIGIPGGRHGVYYGRFQAKHGRDPRVSKRVIHRIASKRILQHLTASS